jgi:hypothetical protein
MLKEQVSKTKKVQDFLNGITDSSFATYKAVINSQKDLLENFENCQQFLKTMDYQTRSSGGNQGNKREVAQVKLNAKGKKKGSKSSKMSSKKGSLDPPHYGHYSNDKSLEAQATLQSKWWTGEKEDIGCIDKLR